MAIEPKDSGRAISIHALREEGDLPWLSLCSAIGKFLSTPSARRATDAPLIWATSLMYFYPRPLRGGRHGELSPCKPVRVISIHALCEEGDRVVAGARLGLDISIHALCEEGDFFNRNFRPLLQISIHALCEEGDRIARARS